MFLGTMKKDYPKTWSYLRQFETLLRSCGIFQQFYDSEKDPFYALYNVGEYTYSSWKVFWRQVSNTLDTVVVGKQQIDGHGPFKPIIPDHSLCSISFSDKAEANYVCAVLNSVIARFIVANYCALHPSPHIMEYLPIRRICPIESIAHAAFKLVRGMPRCRQQGECQTLTYVGI
jgi:hypothetical protein